ncbi:MAG: DNA-directed RNA polymerase subunit alpha [Candidatus Coatesbacteria bacterium]|nr:DNA-directed RNA polymerase subunit alpha [Candidatus Coatesbacteria bacterium]
MHWHWKGISKPKGFVAEEATQFYGRFTAEPFERGFGVTVGNSLRRVLLSSLKGWSVSAVRIEGAKHQFSPVPGVVEDATEIILNLKKLRLRLSVFHPKVIYLSAKGPGKVTAQAIKPDPDVEVLNPDIHVAELDDESELNIEIRIEYGRGYVPADQHDLSDLSEQWIPVDSIFSPVTRVNFSVENVLHLERADYDRLLLEIWTDGSIEPLDAIAQASKILKDIFLSFITFEEPEEEEEEEPREEEVEINPGLKKSIEELDLGSRPMNCLRAANIKYVAQLVSKTEQELLKLENFGKESLREVKKILVELDLELGQDLSEYEELAPLLGKEVSAKWESEDLEEEEEETPKPRKRPAAPVEDDDDDDFESEDSEFEDEEEPEPFERKPAKASTKKPARDEIEEDEAGVKAEAKKAKATKKAKENKEDTTKPRKRASTAKAKKAESPSDESEDKPKKASSDGKKKPAKTTRKKAAEADAEEAND